jgi:hypothetical protein
MSKKTKKLQWKFLKTNGELDRRYKISEKGDIFNVKKGRLVNTYSMCKKSPFNGTDYKSAYVQGKVQRVHRLVCETFHGPAPDTCSNVVLHLDECKDNNHKDNLRWGTSSENTNDYYASRKGAAPRYTPAKISRAKSLINKGYTNDKVAVMTKISDSTISQIKLGRIHRAIEPLTAEQVELGNVIL